MSKIADLDTALAALRREHEAAIAALAKQETKERDAEIVRAASVARGIDQERRGSVGEATVRRQAARDAAKKEHTAAVRRAQGELARALAKAESDFVEARDAASGYASLKHEPETGAHQAALAAISARWSEQREALSTLFDAKRNDLENAIADAKATADRAARRAAEEAARQAAGSAGEAI